MARGCAGKKTPLPWAFAVERRGGLRATREGRKPGEKKGELKFHLLLLNVQSWLRKIELKKK